MKFNQGQFAGKQFPFYVRRSTYVHVALFLLTLIGGKIVIEQQERIRNANIELVQASVKVDMVAMPKYTLNELKNISSGVEEAKKEEVTPAMEEKKIEKEVVPEPEKTEAKVEDKDSGPAFEEANKKKRQSFLDKLKQLGNKKIKSEGTQKAEKGLYGDKSTDLKQLVLAGNKLSKGTAMYGDSNSAEMTAFQAYASRLPDLVRPNWRLPSFLLEKKTLKARIRVWLSANGEVSRAEVYQRSGDDEYDQRAVEAVKSTSFPPLSEEFSKRGQNGDILLGFPL